MQWAYRLLSNSYGIRRIHSPIMHSQYGPIDQLGRSLPSQGRGRGFKSRWVHFLSLKYQITNTPIYNTNPTSIYMDSVIKGGGQVAFQ